MTGILGGRSTAKIQESGKNKEKRTPVTRLMYRPIERSAVVKFKRSYG